MGGFALKFAALSRNHFAKKKMIRTLFWCKDLANDILTNYVICVIIAEV